MIKEPIEEDDDLEEGVSALEALAAEKEETFKPFWQERHRHFLGLIIEMGRKGPPANHPMWDDIDFAIDELWKGRPGELDDITIKLVEGVAEYCSGAEHLDWSNRLDAVLQSFRDMMKLKASARDDLREQIALARSNHAAADGTEFLADVANYHATIGFDVAQERAKQRRLRSEKGSKFAQDGN